MVARHAVERGHRPRGGPRDGKCDKEPARCLAQEFGDLLQVKDVLQRTREDGICGREEHGEDHDERRGQPDAGEVARGARESLRHDAQSRKRGKDHIGRPEDHALAERPGLRDQTCDRQRTYRYAAPRHHRRRTEADRRECVERKKRGVGADRAERRERERARRQPHILLSKDKGAVPQPPRRGDEQRGEQQSVEPQRLVEEQELGHQAEQ